MSDKNLLDKKRDDYTEDGARCHREVLAAIREVKQRFIKEGFKPKEINEIIRDCAAFISSPF